jgi:hypothetical protein
MTQSKWQVPFKPLPWIVTSPAPEVSVSTPPTWMLSQYIPVMLMSQPNPEELTGGTLMVRDASHL